MRAIIENWAVRAAFVLFVVAVPMLAMLPHVRSLVTRNAVVTAFVHTATAPIAGRLVSGPAMPGLAVTDGSTLAVVENERADDALVIELQAQEDALKAYIAQLEDQRESLNRLASDNTEQLNGYRDALAVDTEARTSTVAARLRASEASLVEKRASMKRIRNLASSRSASEAALDEAIASHEAVRATRDAHQAELGRLHHLRRNLTQNLFVVEETSSVNLVRDTLQELKLRQLDLETALTEARGNLEAARQRLRYAKARHARLHRARVQVPDGVLVWQVHAAPGQFVDAGAPVVSYVDCRSLLLDMRIDDTVLSMVERDHPLRFRLFGTREFQEARGELVRGSSATVNHGELATTVRRTERQGQVLARIETGTLSAEAREYCNIGRTAYAELANIGFYKEFLRRIFF